MNPSHKIRPFILSFLIVAMLTAIAGRAESSETEGIPCKTVSLLAGLATSVIGIHEAGHTAAALALGYNLRDVHYRFSSVEVNGLQVGAHDDKIIKMSGFAAQALTTEIILDTKSIPKDNSFVAGILAGNILHPLFYVARAELGTDARDFEGFSKRDRRIAEALVAGYALLAGYRALKNERFRVFITSSGNDIRAVWNKTFD